MKITLLLVINLPFFKRAKSTFKYTSSAIHNIFLTSQIMTEKFSAIEPTINISFIYKLHVYNDYDSNAIKHVLHAFRPFNLLRFNMV